MLLASVALAQPIRLQCEVEGKFADAEAKAAPARHPLKGVIVDVVADKTSLLVKHEEIPGVMRAMTMLLKVTESELKSVQKGQAVTGLLVRKPDGWWLEEVKAATP
jgi:Cu/Ag efflux protein CusF